MKIYLLESESSVEPIVRSCDYRRGVDVIVCFNYLVVVKMKRLSEQHIYMFCEDILSIADYEELHAVADRMDSNWYKFGAEDPTIYQGISFGHLVRGVLSRKYMLPVLVKYGEIIRKALLRWPDCKEIIYDLNFKGISGYKISAAYGMAFDKNLLVEEVCRQLRVSANYLPPAFPLLASANLSRPSGRLSAIIKNRIRALVEFPLNFYGAAVNGFRRGKGIYFTNYFNLSSTNLHLSGRFILRTLILNSFNPLILIRGLRYVDFDRAGYVFTKGDDDFCERLKNVFLKEVHEAKDMYSFNGIDYKNVYSNAIRDIVLRLIPHLIAYLGNVRKILRKYRIGIVIDIDMLDEKSKAVRAATKLEGAKTIYLDHGIQSYRKSMKALLLEEPDIVIGPGKYDPYGHLAPRVLLGNPSMDLYPANKRKNIKSIKRVLFLTFEDNFYARLNRFAYQEKYYEEIFSIFSELAGCGVDLYYKPHPSESREYHEYLFDFFNLDRNKFIYIAGQKFADIIRDMDLVVCNVSNCYYEALAAGVPAVFFEPHFIKDAFCPPLDGCNGKDVFRFESGRELLDFIKLHQTNPTYLNQFVSNFLSNQAHLYMGKLDGLAGKKIVDYVSSLDFST